MDDLARKIATLEAQTAYQYQDIMALKAENKETLRAFQEMRTALEVMNAKLAASDKRHTGEHDQIRNTVERWVDLAFKLIVIAASAYLTATVSGAVI